MGSIEDSFKNTGSLFKNIPHLVIGKEENNPIKRQSPYEYWKRGGNFEEKMNISRRFTVNKLKQFGLIAITTLIILFALFRIFVSFF